MRETDLFERLEHYKDLEPGKWVKVLGWGGADEARKLIVASIERAHSLASPAHVAPR